MKTTVKIALIVMLMFSMLWITSVDGSNDSETNAGWVGINGKPYNNQNTDIQSQGFNVSKNSGDSKLGQSHSLVLDSRDRPHLVWFDDTFESSMIYYVRWDGENWVSVSGIVYNPDDSSEKNSAVVSGFDSRAFHPALALDSNDSPHITWGNRIPGNDEIFYVRWNGENWVCADNTVFDSSNISSSNPANVSKNLGNSLHPSLTLGSDGLPHISWHDSSFGNLEILYVRWDGKNWICADGSVYDSENPIITNPVNVSVSVGSSAFPDLVLDEKNHPQLTWHDETPGKYEIFYVRWNGEEWVCADGVLYVSGDSKLSSPVCVSKNGVNSYYPSLVLDSENNPHITWRDWIQSNNTEILYVRWSDGEWVCIDGSVFDSTNISISNPASVSGNNNSYSPVLTLDSNDNPHIVWRDWASGVREIFHVRWDGTDWLSMHGTVYDRTNTATTNLANVSNTDGSSWLPSLVLDSKDNPHIVWYDDSFENSEICYIRWKKKAPGKIVECKIVLRYQQDSIMYYVDDVEKGPMETPPVIEKSRIFLVVRYITQEIPGTTIDWIQAEKKVIITTSGGKRIELQIGNKDAIIDGEIIQIDPENPDVVPFITAGRTHCPMRFVAEQLGATGKDDIKWFPETKTVEIRFDIPDCE